MIRSAKNQWARRTQSKALGIAEEADSCAAINGAGMSTGDREELQRLGKRIAEILSKY